MDLLAVRHVPPPTAAANKGRYRGAQSRVDGLSPDDGVEPLDPAVPEALKTLLDLAESINSLFGLILRDLSFCPAVLHPVNNLASVVLLCFSDRKWRLREAK